MPTTTGLNAYSNAWPTIINRIRASVFKEIEPLAMLTFLIDTTAGHPARIWSFPGLPRNNYIVSFDEIDGDGNIIQNLATFSVVPGDIDGFLVRADEQITVDDTPGFVAGDYFFVFDGSETSPGSGIFKPDYRGWEIVPSELTGRGILKKGVDYNWDKETGNFLLFAIGDVFSTGTTYNIHFNSREDEIITGYPTLNDFHINFIDSSTSIFSPFFGKKLIVEPLTDFVTVTLPDINTVPEGRPLLVEVSKNDLCCVRFITSLGQTINFLRGSVYALPGETFSIYKFIRPDTTKEWRVCDAYGNFKECGQIVSFDAIPTDVFNAHLLDGEAVSVNKYSRLYNEVVLNLPFDQVCDFADWGTGDNKYKYSYSLAGVFHLPDRRGLYERNTGVGNKAADYLGMSVESHQHATTEGGGNTVDMKITVGGTADVSGGTKFKTVATSTLKTSPYGGSETRPVTNLINKYVLL